jgi:hypothetical protein
VSNVVVLLENIGRNSRLKGLSGQQLADALSLSGLAPSVQAALVEQRSKHLEKLLGASSNVCCLVHAPQDNEPEQEDEPQKDKSAQLVQWSERRAAGAR